MPPFIYKTFFPSHLSLFVFKCSKKGRIKLHTLTF
jgi:hypothetical protein